jgi:hypothetical protein
MFQPALEFLLSNNSETFSNKDDHSDEALAKRQKVDHLSTCPVLHTADELAAIVASQYLENDLGRHHIAVQEFPVRY